MDRWWEDAVDTTEAGEEYWADAEARLSPAHMCSSATPPETLECAQVELGIDLNQPPEEVELGERDAESQAVAVALATIAQDTKAQVCMLVQSRSGEREREREREREAQVEG